MKYKFNLLVPHFKSSAIKKNRKIRMRQYRYKLKLLFALAGKRQHKRRLCVHPILNENSKFIVLDKLFMN